MTIEIVMPQLGNEITEAEITEWVKKAGDVIEEGELLVIITTTKMSLEIEAPQSGTLKEILVQEGELAEVGQTLAVIE
ncbi:biotin/lipoyl-binding protein (plasmid) [Rhizobium sp. RCAM05350]|uniref:biotin/lipoyl-containing protein n=1 Tax=Rhizobium sp. RCAM05350 TaxID=2895568 RepID=UPI002076A297|nr:biotin/lipoyl-containing protein [Rhizobium sp. RCAM05350]URK89397.1 biotin/lipoyl-binding protein [Rhizobium sp. RCAM05350]